MRYFYAVFVFFVGGGGGTHGIRFNASDHYIIYIYVYIYVSILHVKGALRNPDCVEAAKHRKQPITLKKIKALYILLSTGLE